MAYFKKVYTAKNTFNRFTKAEFVRIYISRVPLTEDETPKDFISLLNRADHAYLEYSNQVDVIRNEEFGRTFTRDQEYD